MSTLLFLILLNLSPVFLTAPDKTSPYNLTNHGELSPEQFTESSPGYLREPLTDHLAILSPDYLHYPDNNVNFLLMLDTSKGMASNGKLEHMKAFITNWLLNVRYGINIAIINYGKEATMMSSWVSVDTDIYQLINKISTLTASGGDACTVCGFKMAEQLMLNTPNDFKSSLLSITGQQDGSVGGSIADQSVWEPFKRESIHIQTILYGSEGFALEVLTTETKGKYYTMMEYGRYNSALTDVSKTFVPSVVGDSYEWELMDVAVTGREIIFCSCAKAPMIITDENNKDIKVIFRLQIPGEVVDIRDYIDTVQVEDKSGNSVDGWTFSFENGLSSPMSEPGEFTIHVYLKKVTSHMMAVQIKGTSHRTSPNNEPYIVDCKYPTEVENGRFLISSQVKQGGYHNRVSGGTVFARITKSLDQDPEGLQDACFVKLTENGRWLPPTLGAFDGVYSYIFDPRECFDEVANVEMMTVICNMIHSPDIQITEHNFWE